jgi:hypothetical protein
MRRWQVHRLFQGLLQVGISIVDGCCNGCYAGSHSVFIKVPHEVIPEYEVVRHETRQAPTDRIVGFGKTNQTIGSINERFIL